MNQADRLEAARRFAIDAARLVAATRGHNVVILDVSAISPVTDFFVLATGTSPRQMRAVCEEVEELGVAQDFAALSRSGYEGETWMLADFVDVVLHLFSHEGRAYYDLDGLWGDAKRVDWQETPAEKQNNAVA